MVPGSANESQLKPEVTDIGSVSGSISFALMSCMASIHPKKRGFQQQDRRGSGVVFPPAYVGRRLRLPQMTSKECRYVCNIQGLLRSPPGGAENREKKKTNGNWLRARKAIIGAVEETAQLTRVTT